jgi:hypothetical protein
MAQLTYRRADILPHLLQIKESRTDENPSSVHGLPDGKLRLRYLNTS